MFSGERRGVEVVSSGSFEILTPEAELRGQLLRIERMGRICYQSERGPVTEDSAAQFIKRLIKRGHLSVLEHSSLSVIFHNCSRGFTHELVRHRLASYSQESTRYVDYARGGTDPDLETFQLRVVLPPHRDSNEMITLEDGRQISATEMLSQIESFYRGLRRSGWAPEDARQILPTAVKADIGMTANFSEWRHIFEMRTQKAAHWEIRGVMVKLLEEMQHIVPVVFDDFVQAGVDNNGLKYFEKS